MFKALQRKPPTERLKEKYDNLCKNLRQEIRKLEKDIRVIEREEFKVLDSIRSTAKQGRNDPAVRVLALEQKARLYRTKAEINSLMLKLREHLANAKLTASVSKATGVMKSVHALSRVPELAATMREFEKTMLKMGVADEMMEDAMEIAFNDVDEYEDDEEIDRLVESILNPATATTKTAQKAQSVDRVQTEVEKILEAAVKEHGDLMYG
ncbi:hypothetical protein ACOME3_007577 [Neoechinorhynchus agilis]